MKLVALSRVSTAGQVRDGLGLDAQDARIADWAKREGHRIVEWCRDEGVSGTAPVGERPGLVRALQLLTNERAEGIVVASLDRLSRDLVVQEQLYAEVTGMGCVLRSTHAAEDHALAHDEDDPSRALVRRIFASIHAYERDMIRLRLKAGLVRKAQLGGYVGGRPPYGWAAVGRELVPLPHEQEMRRRIKALRRAGSTYQAIADLLNSEGVVAKSGMVSWSAMSVRSVVLNNRRATMPRPLLSPAITAGTPEQKAG